MDAREYNNRLFIESHVSRFTDLAGFLYPKWSSKAKAPPLEKALKVSPKKNTHHRQKPQE